MHTSSNTDSVETSVNFGQYLEANDNVVNYLQAIDRLQIRIEGIERLEQREKSFAEAIEDLWEKKRTIAQEVIHRYALAEIDGFDLDAMVATVHVRAIEWPDVLQDHEDLCETYKSALGLD